MVFLDSGGGEGKERGRGKDPELNLDLLKLRLSTGNLSGEAKSAVGH